MNPSRNMVQVVTANSIRFLFVLDGLGGGVLKTVIRYRSISLFSRGRNPRGRSSSTSRLKPCFISILGSPSSMGSTTYVG